MRMEGEEWRFVAGMPGFVEGCSAAVHDGHALQDRLACIDLPASWK